MKHERKLEMLGAIGASAIITYLEYMHHSKRTNVERESEVEGARQ